MRSRIPFFVRLSAVLLLSILLFGGCTDSIPRQVTPSEFLPSGGGVSSLLPDGTVQPSDGSATSSGNAVNKTDGTVSFLAAGDVIIHEAVYTDAMTKAQVLASTGNYTQTYYFTGMFDGVSDLVEDADLSFVNFECPIAGDTYGAMGYPNFNAPTEAGDTMVDLGFDIVNVANNHMLDMDGITTGLKNTVEYWNGKDLLTVGGYTETDYDDLRILEKNGIRIAFLSYTYGSNNSRVNSASSEYIVPKIDDDRIKAQVKAADAAADFVIVSMHWGDETSYATNVTKANSEQKRLAKLICEAGGDVILGHHPHVLQDVEWIESSGGNKTLVYYSLGNFISTQHPYTNLVGGFASFSIVRQADGSVVAEDAMLIPHVTYYDSTRASLAVFLLEDFTDALTASHGSQKRSDYNGVSSFTLSDLYKVVTKAVNQDFLPTFLKS